VENIEDPANARSQRTRAALLAATRVILEDEGLHALTMAAVAKRADVTRRAVYLHFASRSDLLVHLFDFVAESEGLTESMQPVWLAPNAAEALDAWARHLSRYHLRVLPVSQAIQRMRASDPDAAMHWKRVMREQRQNCRRLAQRLADDEALNEHWTVDAATDMLWALLADDFVERLLVDREWTTGQFVDYFSSLLRATLLTGPAAPPVD
jgi:AcrR family transcriptional regulator